MAEKLCNLKMSGGVDLNGELLWSNSNPSSSTYDGTQTVITGAQVSEYRYFRVVYALSNTSLNVLSEMIIPKEPFEYALSSPTVWALPGMVVCIGPTYSRNFSIYQSNFRFNSEAYRLNNSEARGDLAMPIAVYGIK